MNEHAASRPGYIEPIQRIEIPDEAGVDHANVTFNRSVLCVFRLETADHTYRPPTYSILTFKTFIIVFTHIL
jgi:hypothetical protein